MNNQNLNITESNLLTIKHILLLFTFVLSFYLLTLLSSLLIPLIFALLLAIIFQPLILFLKKIKTPDWLILPAISSLTLGIVFVIYLLVIQIASDIVTMQDFLFQRLNIRGNDLIHWVNHTIKWMNKSTPMKLNTLPDINGFMKIVPKDQVTKTISDLANWIGGFSISFIMFSIYFVVLLSGIANYKHFLNYVSGEKEFSDIVVNYERIQKSIYSYMVIKVFTSFLSGFMVWGICRIFGINFSFLWGFLTFLLYFIPTFGSFIAVTPPVLMSLIQYDNFDPSLYLLVSLIAAIFIIGNIVEPIIMGDKLKLNTLTIIFGLVFWGFIWGIPGLILSVPLLSLMKLILEQFPSTKILARIMGTARSN